MIRRSAHATLALFLVIAAIGCSESAPVNLIEEADTLCRDQKWEAAIDVLRVHLIHNPHDAGGHFLLGRAHLNLEHLVVAEGQFETAHRLFIENGQKNPIPRFNSDDYFELMCFIERIKVYQKQYLFLLEFGAGRAALQDRVDKWETAQEEVRRIDPDWNELPQFEEILRRVKQSVQSMPETPRNPDAPTVVPLNLSA